jgi:hypothetical protein
MLFRKEPCSANENNRKSDGHTQKDEDWQIVQQIGFHGTLRKEIQIASGFIQMPKALWFEDKAASRQTRRLRYSKDEADFKARHMHKGM